MQSQHLNASGDLGVVGQRHPAFTRDDILGGIETEHAAGPNRACLLAVILRLDSVRAIFDNYQIMFAGERHERIHFAGATGEMHSYDRLGSRRDLLTDLFGIEIKRTWFDINENRSCASVDDG